MPMSREAKMEKVQRLLTAHKKTSQTLESEPVTHELHPGTDIARNWTVITAAYSGLEQTLKFLIAEKADLTITELIDLAPPQHAAIDERPVGRHPYRTHDLAWLFSELEQPARDVVQDFYGRFQSLHSYVPIADADEFLTEISGPGGAGYERWRYTLIEDRPLPRNSPETLSAIWGVCVQMAEQNLWNNQRVQMPDKQLTQHFCQQLEILMVNVSVDRQNAGEAFRDVSGEIRGWLWRAGHPLNAFAEVLWNFSRYGSHGADGVSDWLSEALTRWVRDVLANPAASARTSLRAFLNRAQGHTPDGASIRWNPQPERFEATPWSLEDCFVDALPREAILIADPVPRATPLNTLWVAARESGCRVLENRAFNGPADQENWFCTLRVQAEDAGAVKPILSMWQKRDDDHDLFHMVEEAAPEEMEQPLRRWIALAKKIAEIRLL